jgi:hypothetical protein
MTEPRSASQDRRGVDEYHFEWGDPFPQAGHHVTENFASHRGHLPPVLNVSNGMPHPSGPHVHRMPGVYIQAQIGQRISVIAGYRNHAGPNRAPRSRPAAGRR